MGDVLTADEEITSETESRRADELLSARFPGERPDRGVCEVIVVGATSASVDEPAASGECTRWRGRASGRREHRDDDRGRGERRLVSADRDAPAMPMGLGFDGEDDVEDVYDVVQRLDDEPGYQAAVTGELTSDADQEELSGEDLRKGELFFGLPVALVILLAVFGTVVAGLVPLILAMVSIVVALALAALVGQAFELSIYTVNMLTAMGLALGIDYSLFVLSRYREERCARARPTRGDRRGGGDGQPRRPLQRDDVRARDVRAGARAQHDLPKPRGRGDPRGHRVGACCADAASGGARPAGRSRQRAAGPVLRPHRGP